MFQFVEFDLWHVLRPDAFGMATTYCGLVAEGKEPDSSEPETGLCAKCGKVVGRISADKEVS